MLFLHEGLYFTLYLELIPAFIGGLLGHPQTFITLAANFPAKPHGHYGIAIFDCTQRQSYNFFIFGHIDDLDLSEVTAYIDLL